MRDAADSRDPLADEMLAKMRAAREATTSDAALSSREYAYIAVRPCGCVTAAAIDDGIDPDELAKDIGAWFLSGRSVERVRVEEAKERLTLEWPCVHEREAERDA